MRLRPRPRTAPSCWIIALGSLQCGDDGIGPFVARKLSEHIGTAPDVTICTLSQLDSTLVEKIQEAELIIFVDACGNPLRAGLEWSRVEPELNGWAMGSHLSPGLLLGLLQVLYQRCPAAWMVSVQGCCFELEEKLSPEALRNAEKAAGQIIDWLSRNSIARPTKTGLKASASAFPHIGCHTP